MEIGGAVGLSLVVLHRGEAIYQANFGLRDIPQSLPPTEETIFPACSLVKPLTAAIVALLVEEGIITWDTLVKDVLPKFNPKDDILRNYTTIADLLCRRTGMAWGDNLYIGTDNNVLISGENSMKYINSQEPLLPFRGQYAYNNIPYELAGHVIEKLTGSTWSEVLKTRILDRIGLDRTSLKTPLLDVDNVAKCYNTLGLRRQSVVPQLGMMGFVAQVVARVLPSRIFSISVPPSSALPVINLQVVKHRLKVPL